MKKTGYFFFGVIHLFACGLNITVATLAAPVWVRGINIWAALMSGAVSLANFWIYLKDDE